LRPRTTRVWKWYAEKAEYFNPIRDVPLDELSRKYVKEWCDKVADDVGTATANSCHTFLSAFLGWAQEVGLIPDDKRLPTAGGRPFPENERKRVLTDDEIRLIWKTCEDATAEIKREQEEFASTGRRPRGHQGRVPIFSYIIQLLFFTGCRAGEIGGLQRCEIVSGLDPSDNANELRIPGARRKARKKHEDELTLHVPLAQGAIEILRQIARRSDGSDCFFGKRGRTTNELRTWIDDRITKAGETPPKDWRVHDIRRTFRSRLSRLRVPKDIGEMLLGHLLKKGYDQHDYWSEMQEAIEKWERHLHQIIDGTVEQVPRPQHRRVR
jgi:integrase